MKCSALVFLLAFSFTLPFVVAAEPLPGTSRLTLERPLDVVMVEGINRHAEAAIERAVAERERWWSRSYASADAYAASVEDNRQRFREYIGAVDERLTSDGFELIATTNHSAEVGSNERYRILAVRLPVLPGVTTEGLLLKPVGRPIARVVAVPDADWSPEQLAGLDAAPNAFAATLAAGGCEVFVPAMISRECTHSGNPSINRRTNQPHREFLYRQSFELGRHIIGYEVQKILAAVDQFSGSDASGSDSVPIIVAGAGEGGLLAFYSAAVDTRIDAAIVSGYFDQRESLWQEPIYRNVWRLLEEFGDAGVASLIAPRSLIIEPTPVIPEISGPPDCEVARSTAAPGRIEQLDPESVRREALRAAAYWQRIPNPTGRFLVLDATASSDQPLAAAALQQAFSEGCDVELDRDLTVENLSGANVHAGERQKRQFMELIAHNQMLLRQSSEVRDALWSQLDHSSVEGFQRDAADMRDFLSESFFGNIDQPFSDPNVRSRKILDTDHFTGYEVVLDVFPDVIAGGILLLPNDLQHDERRPVVVCQHGLEGVPMDTISGPDSRGYRAYKSFAASLAQRGFIVYAPQNPYRGGDAFRVIQRKANPLGRSLFSYIIPQHQATLRFLAELPNVDAERIAFYGLSYGGKTAVRVPPMLPPRQDEPGYCLSICSADFNEWVAKNASYDAPFSYLYTGEYEIFEWNMAHVANYAELSMLMTPRPFMVERGHDDGVGIDEWVAWEFAKVRRHYNKLGIGERTEIEYFDGPHTINGQGTFRFLHRHLSWPADKAPNSSAAHPPAE